VSYGSSGSPCLRVEPSGLTGFVHESAGAAGRGRRGSGEILGGLQESVGRPARVGLGLLVDSGVLLAGDSAATLITIQIRTVVIYQPGKKTFGISLLASSFLEKSQVKQTAFQYP
jgi:hypothetical protein